MVMRIQENRNKQLSQLQFPSSSAVARSTSHTGQEQVRHAGAVSASILLRQGRIATQLNERRQLRLAHIQRQLEMASAFSVEIDARLLTGDLDHDISLLNIVA